MTQKEIDIIQKLEKNLPGLPEEKQNYLLGLVTGLDMAAARQRMEKATELAAARRQAEDKETQERAGA